MNQSTDQIAKFLYAKLSSVKKQLNTAENHKAYVHVLEGETEIIQTEAGNNPCNP